MWVSVVLMYWTLAVLGGMDDDCVLYTASRASRATVWPALRRPQSAGESFLVRGECLSSTSCVADQWCECRPQAKRKV
ncbi:hypothetical protein P5V15_015139 [Pogonomyrmex californicus]